MTDHSLVKNAADPEQVRSAGSKEKRKREREVADLAEILSTRTGRRFFWRVLEYCKVLKDPEGVDTHQTYLNIGVQSVGRWLIREMDVADMSAWEKMRKEDEGENNV